VLQFALKEAILIRPAILIHQLWTLLFAGCSVGCYAAAQSPETALNPKVKQVVEGISEQRIVAALKMLGSFRTRHINSPLDDPVGGIGAAQRWIYSEFKSYGSRLNVSYQSFTVPKGGTAVREAQLANVVAVLPGVADPDRYVLVTAHYDSINIVRSPLVGDDARVAALMKTGTGQAEAKRFVKLFPESGSTEREATAAQQSAPGANDDGSGIAAILELARVMSQQQYGKSIVFIAFSAEEGLHEGSKTYAALAKKDGMQIEAVLNNDIIGGALAGNGQSANGVLRGFAEGPEDSGHRALLRYAKEIAERYVPSMELEPVFHIDRFGRGGDQMSFVDQGYPAIRLTSSSENFANEHSSTDTMANVSVPYLARAVRMNAAIAASLALAPRAPVVNWVFQSGKRKGELLPMLSRGNSGYDAVLRWKPDKDANVAGYAVVIRRTTSPTWEREIWVGKVDTFTISDFSIDNVVLGVKAVDFDGNATPVSAYLEPPYIGSVR
jgi:hypothetical protein